MPPVCGSVAVLFKLTVTITVTEKYNITETEKLNQLIQQKNGIN